MFEKVAGTLFSYFCRMTKKKLIALSLMLMEKKSFGF